MEPMLISSFCSVKQMRDFDSPGMGNKSITASLPPDTDTDKPTPEGWKAELA